MRLELNSPAVYVRAKRLQCDVAYIPVRGISSEAVIRLWAIGSDRSLKQCLDTMPDFQRACALPTRWNQWAAANWRSAPSNRVGRSGARLSGRRTCRPYENYMP